MDMLASYMQDGGNSDNRAVGKWRWHYTNIVTYINYDKDCQGKDMV